MLTIYDENAPEPFEEEKDFSFLPRVGEFIRVAQTSQEFIVTRVTHQQCAGKGTPSNKYFAYVECRKANNAADN